MKSLSHLIYELDAIQPAPDLVDFSQVLAEISERLAKLAVCGPLVEHFEVRDFCSALLAFRYRLDKWNNKYNKEKP